MKLNRRSKWQNGALVGGLLAAPLIAIFYLASQVAGLPFIPFDLLDWAARNLPGPVITFGIDLIVSMIAAFNLGETSSAAKTAEQIIAIVGFWLAGVLAGAVLFAFLSARQSQRRTLPGLLLGMFLGILALSVSAQVNQNMTVDPFFRDLWVIGAFIVWGIALNRVYAVLRQSTPVPITPPPGSALEVGAAHEASVEPIDRRQFIIRLGGASAVITVVGAGLGSLIASGKSDPVPSLAWSDNNPLPNANAAPEPAPGMRPEFTKVENHYRIDINALPPVIREADWALEITGLVRNPVMLTLNDLRNNFEPLHQFVTLSCISNPLGGDLISTQRWTGVSLQQIMREASPTGRANHLYVSSADGFYESIARSEVLAEERIMLTYDWDGLPLPTEHGFPLRVYIPDRYGMKQPKWIIRIELTETPEEGYWVRRGWDEVARVKTTSVIDSVGVDSLIEDGDETLVPIGGIAYSGERGIERVEVRVDDGEWHAAQLREPISDLTWVLWRYDWPFQEGEHVFTVRCLDGKGQTQDERYRDTRPSGATGFHVYRANL
jgi:DMSO/TMAO reductase YedYZ molybdopterin-dependent catalytic subunit